METKIIIIGGKEVTMFKTQCKGVCKQFFWTHNANDNYLCGRCAFESRKNTFNPPDNFKVLKK